MPYNFTAASPSVKAAGTSVVEDGAIFTVADGYGHTVTSTLSLNTAFQNNPVRSGTGVWSVTLKDAAILIHDIDVKTILASTNYLSVQLLPVTAASNGATVLNWVFNSAGTPTDLPSSGSPQFLVYVNYSDAGY